MAKIVFIDAVGDACGAAEEVLREAGHEVATATELSADAVAGADAMVLAVEAARVGDLLEQVTNLRGEAEIPVVLATHFDRSGWDRTFSSSEALGVDALFDLPVDAEALANRLEGILAARREAKRPASPDMEAIVERAIANEEASAAFYRRAAEQASDPDTEEALQGLLHDEEEHKRLLEDFRSGARSLPDESPKTGSLVEKFGAPDFNSAMSPQDAFLLAARKEKLAMEFYEDWAQLYPDGPERDLLLRLADVERRHKARVEAMFANAAFPESL